MTFSQIIKYFREELGMPVASTVQLAVELGHEPGRERRARDILIDEYCTETGESPDDLTGMVLRTDTDLYKSTKWKTLRNKFLALFDYKCMKCGEYGDQVDHVLPRTNYPELAYDASNFQLLCGTCNKQKGDRDETDYRTEEHKEIIRKSGL